MPLRAFEWAICVGSIKTPSIKENISVPITTNPISGKKSPSIPSNIKNKENATIVVRIAEKTAGRTSKVPLIAAVIRSSPFSYLWYIFSAIIIPSSTRIPITIIIPKSEITFKVIP